MPLLPSMASSASTGFLPHATGEAAFAILVLASLRHESDSPMTSQPYMMAGTAAVRAMSVVLTHCLRAFYRWMFRLKSESLFLNPTVDLRAPPTVSVPSSLTILAVLVLSEAVALTTALPSSLATLAE